MKIVPRDARIRFRCKMCGSCCRKLLNLEITAYDIANWWEQGNIDIIAHLVAVQDDVAKSYGVPFIFTFPRRGDGSCIYLRGNLCSIHPVKPLACRIYPFGLGPSYELIIQEECSGLGEGEEVDLNEIVRMIRKHLAGVEALKIPEVRDKVLDIVSEAKRRYLESIGCLEYLERIMRMDKPDYHQVQVFPNIGRKVYIAYYGDLGELLLRIEDLKTLASWFAENTKGRDDYVTLVHLHSHSENDRETCKGIAVLYSCSIDSSTEALRRSIELINDLSVELVTVFLRS